ncbi:hypothetical protein WJ32_18960 (plasmid) [Burkholderia ubonensis]|uniref:Transposase IS66 C-terminal domain-containing protein n=1 Tax=Burkholderia ubonensis TaxID=101571 RepID=A0A103R8S4_9BURK|nr:transposase domain-containing protein [Burkholderia ubonensis]AOJ64651.1 hypothetical protein WJ32_18960 [Burkholderia ubonensis]KVG63254.1 hypothetical protein WJ33_28890 [Burkholderia ubonensis]
MPLREVLFGASVANLVSTTLVGTTLATSFHPVETVLGTRLQPYRYLVWLFTRLPLAATADDYATLMPWSMPAALNR